MSVKMHQAQVNYSLLSCDEGSSKASPSTGSMGHFSFRCAGLPQEMAQDQQRRLAFAKPPTKYESGSAALTFGAPQSMVFDGSPTFRNAHPNSAQWSPVSPIATHSSADFICLDTGSVLNQSTGILSVREQLRNVLNSRTPVSCASSQSGVFAAPEGTHQGPTGYDSPITNFPEETFKLPNEPPQTWSVEDANRRNKRRERNKIAATKCRNKKKEIQMNLVLEADLLQRQFQTLSAEKFRLEQEMQALAQILCDHQRNAHSCPLQRRTRPSGETHLSETGGHSYGDPNASNAGPHLGHEMFDIPHSEPAERMPSVSFCASSQSAERTAEPAHGTWWQNSTPESSQPPGFGFPQTGTFPSAFPPHPPPTEDAYFQEPMPKHFSSIGDGRHLLNGPDLNEASMISSDLPLVTFDHSTSDAGDCGFDQVSTNGFQDTTAVSTPICSASTYSEYMIPSLSNSVPVNESSFPREAFKFLTENSLLLEISGHEWNFE